MTSLLHFLQCGSQCYSHNKLHPKYSITYDKSVALINDAIHIGSLVRSTRSMLQRLPMHYHKFLLLFDPEHVEKLPDH